MSRRYLLDSGPAFDFLFKRKGVYDRVHAAWKSGAKVGICVPVLGEIHAGLAGSASFSDSFRIARAGLSQLTCLLAL